MSRKSIIDLSKEINVSRQAIHQRIKQEPLQSALKDSISYVGKKMFVDDEGVKLIKQAYFKKLPETIDEMDETVDRVDAKVDCIDSGIDTIDKQINDIDKEKPETSSSSSQNISVDNEIIKLLQQNINILQTQLDVKDKQIEELTSTVKNLSESINADRKNELVENFIDGNVKLIESESKKEGNFLQRIFKSKKNR